MDVTRRKLIAILTGLATLPASNALADRKRRRRGRRRDDDHDDHEEAAKARRSGEILPLGDIIDEVNKTYKGEIVSIEFEREDGVWVYEIKMVTPDNRYLEIYVDAKTNQITKVGGK